MFNVSPLTRAELDTWPIQESGLSTRVLNGARAAQVTTLGDLRAMSDAEIIAIRTLGRVSLRTIHRYFELCDRIERGQQVFLTIREIFDLFLDQDEINVLARRYGLLRLDRSASRNFMTLQEIANETQRTRERIRQVTQQAQAGLTNRMARHCFKPFLLYVTRFMESKGKAITCEECGDLEEQSWLAGYNPCALMLLLHDLNPGSFTALPGVMTTIPHDEAQRAITAAEDWLDGREDLVPLADLHQALAAQGALQSSQFPPGALGKMLDQSGHVGATVDGRYFSFKTGTAPLLLEILLSGEQPAHYRTLGMIYNQHVKPTGRKGHGTLLKHITRSPLFRKTDRGLYAARKT